MIEKIFFISLTTSVIILILKLFSTLFGNVYMAKWRYYLWLALAFRLILPFTLSIPEPVHVTTTDTFFKTIYLQVTTANGYQNTALEQSEKPELDASTSTSINFFIAIWAIGSFIFMTYHIIGYYLFRKKILRWSTLVRDQSILDIFENTAIKMNVAKSITLYYSEQVTGPMLIGFFSPMLIWPHNNHSDDEIQFIFKHELTHFKRWDLWYKLFFLFVNAIYWYNPFVYLMRNEAYRDLEMVCDNEITKNDSFDEKQKYGGVILKTAADKPAHSSLSTCLSENSKTLNRRLVNLLGNKQKKGLTVFFTLLILLGFICTFVSYKKVEAMTNKSNYNMLVSELAENPAIYSLENEQNTIDVQNDTALIHDPTINISFPKVNSLDKVAVFQTVKTVIEEFYGANLLSIDSSDISLSNMISNAEMPETVLPDSLAGKLMVSLLSEKDDILYTATVDTLTDEIVGIDTIVKKSKTAASKLQSEQFITTAVDIARNKLSIVAEAKTAICYVPTISGHEIFDREVIVVFPDVSFYIALQVSDLSPIGYRVFSDFDEMTEYLVNNCSLL